MDAKNLSRRSLLATAIGLSIMPRASWSSPIPQSRLWIDGLSFLPRDLSEISRSGLRAMICDVSEVEEVKDADGHPKYLRTFEANDVALDRAIARISASREVYVALKGTDIGKQPGCAAFLQFQSCETIGSDLGRLGYFHEKGLRVIQLTHHNDNLFAGGAIEPHQSGLTRLGQEGVREMNRLGLLVDVSHGSAPTILETARLSQKPVVYSHGACRAIVDNPRCINDEGIRAIADGGGSVGIFMMSFWLTRATTPKMSDWVAHIRHVINIGGLDAAAVANDFPVSGQENLVRLQNNNKEGVKEYLAWWQAMNARGVPGFDRIPEHVVIPEFNSIDRLEMIQRALVADGFKSREIDKIMGGNWQRVLTDVLG